MFPLKTLYRNSKKALLEPGFAAKALLKRTRALLGYSLNKKGKAPPPESLTLLLTHECNLRCRMCGQWGDAGANKSFSAERVQEKMELAAYKKLLNEIKEFNPHITLLGGEPLLYPEFAKLVAEIKQRGLHLGIITNGILLKKYAAVIVNAGVDVVSLSVDGPAEIHDRVRNCAGAYLKIKEGTDELARLKKAKKTAKPLINIVCTLSELNYKAVKKMPAAAEELGADSLNFHHLLFTGNAVLEEHNKYFTEKFGVASLEWAGFVRPSVKEIEPEKLARELAELKAGKYPFSLAVYPDFGKEELFKYYTAKEFVSREYPRRCISPWVVAYVYPDGGLRPCQGPGFVAGNIKNTPFFSVWNGEKMRAFRRELKKQKYFKVCPKCTEMYRY